MAAQTELLAFNRGVVSRDALARLDLKRLALAAEEQTNMVPRALGPMSLRPGMQYLFNHQSRSVTLPFVFSANDKAGIELSTGTMRVMVNDALLTRPTVSATITNGSFTTDLAGWADSDESGCTSAWVAGGYMGLTGDGTNAAIREQGVVVVEPNIAHALRIEVQRGPVVLRVGAALGGSEFLRETTLGTGTHSIVVVPSSTMYVQLLNRNDRLALVASVSVEAGGVFSLPMPYTEDDLTLIRHRQSGDVLYLACAGTFQQRKLERRANGSWSVVLYQPEDGPFRVENVGPTTVTPSALRGNISLTASKSLFDVGHVGALWRITSTGQRVEATASAANVFGDPVRVFGIGESRRFAIIISGTFVATVTLQRSVGDVGAWEDVTTYTAATPDGTTYNDALDNQIVYYRLGVKAGNYTSGTATMRLNYSAGALTGVVRITDYTSDVLVSAEVLQQLGGTDATDVWAEGAWSTYRGWPSAVTIIDGRLMWAGKDRFVGSVTDQYETFNPEFEGDAAPINRSIGHGPVDVINWLLALSRLLAGTDTRELAVRSSSFDEPLTPLNFNPRTVGTQGSAQIAAEEIDNRGVFVQRGLQRLYELAYSIETQDYIEDDLTKLCPDFLAAGVVGIAVQRQPDTRVHCWLADGTVGMLVLDKLENLVCWVKVETSGFIEHVLVLPGAPEDEVFYSVRRNVAGYTVRFMEKWAKETECRGGLANKQADAFVYAEAAASTIALPHLETETVVVWAEGQDLGTFTVVGGSITLPGTYTHRCAGLPYEGRFKSAKLAYSVPPGKSALNAKKRVNSLGMVLNNTHPQGVEYGPDYDTMDALPLVHEGMLVDQSAVHGVLETETFSFPGVWGVDSRVCIRASAPRPATVQALVVEMETNPR